MIRLSNFSYSRFLGLLSLGITLVLAGCQSTTSSTRSVGPNSVGPNSVGPGVYAPLGAEITSYNYQSEIFLDVAIPVFDPGLPYDSYGNLNDEELVEEDIWPQVRRAEAKRFALATKEALAKTKSFGAISVTPTTNISADLFVLGRINYSDTETVNIGIKVMDGSNRVWGEKQFEHRVSPGFYRDASRSGTDPYGPVFRQIADYVYSLIRNKKDDELADIKLVSSLRYAASYSPESFGPYLETKTRRYGGNRYSVYQATGAPSPDDPMLKRIEAIRAQDQMFVDNLQENYDFFSLETDQAYRKYQRETMPVARKIREEKNARTFNQVAAAGVGILAGILAVSAKNDRDDRVGERERQRQDCLNSGGTAEQCNNVSGGSNSNEKLKNSAAVAAGALAAYTLTRAVSNNRELGKQRALLNEMGRSIDIELSPQVMEFEDQEVELTGNAGEQYEQWKAHLRRIYELEATPDIQL